MMGSLNGGHAHGWHRHTLLLLWTVCFLLRPCIGSRKVTPCFSPIYCYGPILHAVQLSGIFTDSKTYVDRPLKQPPETALAAFAQLGPWPNISQTELRAFVDTYFDAPGADVLAIVPADFKTVDQGGLPLHSHIKNTRLRDFAVEIHNRWRSLGRQVASEVSVTPTQHSIIPLPNPFIVPGGRFRECYYWDSFWTLQGLLVSGMTDTAKGMLLNFAYLIDQYGLIPNGNRVYYIRRSEPPVLALMIDHYIKHKNVPPADADFVLRKMLPYLEKEYKFWMKERAVTVSLSGVSHTLNHYTGGGLTTPRPESYFEDYHDAQELLNKSIQSPMNFYSNVAAGAESGLDFSTRWLDSPGSDFLTIRTRSILPVDLNAMLCATENVLSDLFQLTGDQTRADMFRQLALDRGDAIHAIFWNSTLNMWRDYDMKLHRQRSTFYLSDVAPIVARCSGRSVDITSDQFMAEVLASTDMQMALELPGGTPFSFVQAAGRYLQWDFPNAWPPMQLMLIEGFNDNPQFRTVALQWAQKWVTSVYTGFINTTHIYEKYDARTIGGYGSGGEYVVQEGFGWTNGGVLRLMELFPADLQAPAVDFRPVGPDGDPAQSA